VADDTIFPAFIRAEYDPSGNGFQQFERAASDTVARTRRTFETSFEEIGRVINNAVGKGLNAAGTVDLDVGKFRQAAAEARAYAESLSATLTSARALAQSTGDTSQATRIYLQALSAQNVEAQRAVTQAEAQVASYSRLQSAMDATAGRNNALAQSYRGLFSEQAKAAQAEVVARRAQEGFGQVFSPGLSRSSKSAADSAEIFKAAAAMQDLRDAEEGAARGANLLAAAQRGTGLELGRVVKSARDSASVFQAAADADDRLARAAQQAWADLDRQATAMGRASAAAREAREAMLAASSAFNTGGPAENFDAQVRGYKDLAAAALSVQRGAGGSLNLGVEQHREAAAAAEAHAIVLRELATQLERVALGEGDTSESTRLEIQAAQSAAREEAEHAAALRSKANAVEQLQASLSGIASQTNVVIGAQQQFNQSLFRGVDGARAQRFAMIQIGQQMQDVAIGFAGGQRAATIFAQQLPQLGFALIGFESSANRTLQTLGKFGTFLSGPWGAAITIAGVALGALSGAFSGAEKQTYHLTDAMDFQKLSINDLITAINQLDAAQGKANQTSYEAEQLALKNAEAALKAAVATREQAKANLLAAEAEQQRNFSAEPGAAGARGGLGALSGIFDSQIAELTVGIQQAQDFFRKTQVPIADREAKAKIDEVAAATLRYDKALAKLRDRFLNIKDIDAAEYQSQKAILDKRLADQIKAARDNGAAARRAAREAIANANAQASAETRLQKIIEQNTTQPTRVQRANIQNLDIDKLEGELTRTGRMTETIRKQIVEARQAIRDNLLEPYRDYVKEQQQSIAVGQLVARGRDVESNALRDIFRLQDQVGTLTREQVQQVLLLAQAQDKVADAIDKQRRVIGIYVDAVHDAQRTFEGFLGDLQSKPQDAFKNLGKNLQASFRGLQTKLISEQLFGGLDKEIERFVKGDNGIEAAGDYLRDQVRNTGSALDTLIDSIRGAAQKINSVPANDNLGLTGSSLASLGLSPGFISSATSSLVDDKGQVKENQAGDIIVTASKDFSENIGIAGKKLTDQLGLARDVNEKIWNDVAKKFTANLEQMLGTTLPSSLSGILGGGAAGYAQAGPVGAVLGSLKGIKGLPDKLDSIFGKQGTLTSALGGAQTGQMVGSVMKALGIKTSQTGAAIGGAIGSFIPIPGGQIIGSAIGGIIGGLFKKVPKGAAQITSVTDDPIISGNNSKAKAAAATAASSVQEGLLNIAQMLGADVGKFNVSIGTYKGNYRVNTSGSSKLGGYAGSASQNEKQYGLYDFGKDGAADAIKFAIADAVKDGALLGLRASTQRLLQAGKDIEGQVDKAVKFENVFKDLKRATDPVGAAIDDLNDQFKNLVSIFHEAGATTEEYSQLEQLYAIQRKQAVEQAASSMTSSLKSLLQDLTVGNDALSLKDRLSTATQIYNPLADRVRAGDTTAYDQYADAARNVLDIQRQLYGSQEEYFSKLQEVTNLTATALQNQNNVTSIANATSTPFDIPSKADSSPQAVNDNSAVVSGINDLYGMTLQQLASLNGSTAKLVELMQGAAGGVRLPFYRLGF